MQTVFASVSFSTEPVRWDVGVLLCLQCHGLWDNKEVEMPDFFKKLKRKTEKNKMTGGSRRREENTSGRIPFFSLRASYTSFFRRQRAESPERQGNFSTWKYTDNAYKNTYTRWHIVHRPVCSLRSCLLLYDVKCMYLYIYISLKILYRQMRTIAGKSNHRRSARGMCREAGRSEWRSTWMTECWRPKLLSLSCKRAIFTYFGNVLLEKDLHNQKH